MEPSLDKSNYYTDTDEMINWFEKSAENAAAVQRQTLRRILELNHGVEYLKKWLGDIRLQDENAMESLYATMVPLASHADFEPYIHRIADGEKAPLLTQDPMRTLSLRYTFFNFILGG